MVFCSTGQAQKLRVEHSSAVREDLKIWCWDEKQEFVGGVLIGTNVLSAHGDVF